MATVGAAADVVLERKVLLAAEDGERADRRIRIRAMQDDALGNL
jgi:hypothetical protein